MTDQGMIGQASGKEARPACPYVGLQPFREADHPYFFGRERDQRIIIANLLSSSLTVLYGGSGVGKSSVLMAGVLPQLQGEREDTPVVMVREWSRQDFASEFKRACINAAWRSNPLRERPSEQGSLDDILIACTQAIEQPMLLIFDQLEEYFLYHPNSSDPNSFEAQLARSINRDDVDARFLFSLREDGLSKLDRFRARIPNLFSNRLPLRHLNADGARDAMRRPLEVWNRRNGADVSIEDALVETLIAEVGTGQISTTSHGGSGSVREQSDQIEAPYLQQVLVRLWEYEIESVKSGVLRKDTLVNHFGGPKAIVRGHVNEVMSNSAQLSREQQEACANFFDRLVTPSGAKIACRSTDLEKWVEAANPALVKDNRPTTGKSFVETILENLASQDVRILRTVANDQPDPESTSYEIYHDVLAPAILDWRQQYVAERERRLAKAAADKKAEQDKADALKQAKEQANRLALRNARRWSVVLAIALTLAAVGWYAAFRAHQTAESNRLAALAQNELAVDARKGLRLALQAVHTTSANPLLLLGSTEAAEDALRSSIQASRLEWTLKACDEVADVAISADGSMIAAGCWDGRARVWDISTDKRVLKATLVHDPRKEGDINVIWRLAFSPDGGLFTVGGNKIKHWNLDAPDTPVGVFDHGAPIGPAFTINPELGRIATASGSRWPGEARREIKVWDYKADAAEPITIDTDGAWVKSLSLSPDGCCVASAQVHLTHPGRKECNDVKRRSTTSVWEIDTGRELLNVPFREAGDAVLITDDGTSIIAGYRDNHIRVWTPTGGSLKGRIAELQRQEELLQAEFAATLAQSVRDARGRDESSVDADAEPERPADTEAIEDHRATASETEPPVVQQSATDAEDGRTALVVPHTPPCEPPERTDWFERTLAGHANRVRKLAISPDGTRLASAGADKLTKVWDLETGEHLLDLKGHHAWVEAARFSPDGHHIATASRDGTVKWWSVAGHSGAVNTLAFTPDGSRLVTGSADKTAMVWEVGQQRPKPIHRLDEHANQIYQVAIDPDARLMATAGYDRRVKLWHLPTGRRIANLKSWDALRDVTFSDPPGYLATAAASGRGLLFKIDGEQVERISVAVHAKVGASDFVQASAVLILADKEQWITAGYDGKLKLWDFSSPNARQVGEIELAERGDRFVYDLALTPDGEHIAVLSYRKGRVQVFPLTAFQEPGARSLRVYSPPQEDVKCSAFAFSPERGEVPDLLAIGCDDAEAYLLDRATGAELKNISIHSKPVVDFAFSPDGKTLATASHDGSFHVSPLDLATLHQYACRLYRENLGEEADADELLSLGCDFRPASDAPREEDAGLRDSTANPLLEGQNSS